jgi:hypothetical protein
MSDNQWYRTCIYDGASSIKMLDCVRIFLNSVENNLVRPVSLTKLEIN